MKAITIEAEHNAIADASVQPRIKLMEALGQMKIKEPETGTEGTL
jgi:hypothetical protein